MVGQLSLTGQSLLWSAEENVRDQRIGMDGCGC